MPIKNSDAIQEAILYRIEIFDANYEKTNINLIINTCSHFIGNKNYN